MGGALRKTMVYLGLAEDDERYEAYDVEEDAQYEADEEFADEAYDERRRAEPRLDSRTEPRMEPRDADRRAAVTPIGDRKSTRLNSSHQR